ncbi:Multiple coagulation factor deficiency protein 2-like protein [Harpegnathos saltator]|uniref:Multiple coagulation factor deficiency protein 2-like protein n=2 Tax=Harpegnathos saltator TaxID=610380 RepID=E2BDN7_HARSA|nr:Multiple coagulation factor deficiency protein 2-like protein [Harpegnathos saltator]
MGEIFLIGLWISLLVSCTNSIRGPHHPKSTLSHHHYTPRNKVKLTEDSELLHDVTHLKEDLGPLANQLDFSKMTDQEIEFHYFKVHDFDNNIKLDGLEILHAVQHTLHEKELEDDDDNKKDKHDLPSIVGLIDRALDQDDVNNDGYLEYVEYVIGKKRNQNAQEKRSKFEIGIK